MVNASDIVELPISNDSFAAGLHYAALSWAATFNRMGFGDPYKRLEKILIGVVVENEFIHYLKTNHVKYDLTGRTEWYKADRYDIGIKDVPVDIKSTFIDLTSSYIKKKYRENPSKFDWFLNCQALVPMSQFNCSEERRIDKNYLFPFLEGYFSQSTMAAPLVHIFWDYRWLRKKEYAGGSPERLMIGYSNPDKNARIRIYGTTEPEKSCIEDIPLSSKHVLSQNKFYEVFSVVWIGDDLPIGRVTIRRDQTTLREVINNTCDFSIERIIGAEKPTIVNNWRSLKLYDSKLFLLGWISDDDFRLNGNQIDKYSRDVEQYQGTLVDNWGCLISDLEPISSI